jgi:putative FmdB family regulatory protein
MPIYLYQCDACGVRFERQQRISEPPLEECPECEGHVRRIIQPVGVIFKGSGFYVTDNRQGSSPTLKPVKDQASSDGKDSAPAEPAKEPKDKEPAPKPKAEPEA